MPYTQGHSGPQGGGHSNPQFGGHSSVTQMAGGLLGRVANHALNGKPSNQQHGGQQNPQGHSYGGTSGQVGQSHGLLPALGHSLFGHHQQVCFMYLFQKYESHDQTNEINEEPAGKPIQLLFLRSVRDLHGNRSPVSSARADARSQCQY